MIDDIFFFWARRIDRGTWNQLCLTWVFSVRAGEAIVIDIRVYLRVLNRVRDLKSILFDICVFWACRIECETWNWLTWHVRFLYVLNRVRDHWLVLMTRRCGASFSSNTETNSFGRASLISSDIGQTKTPQKGFYLEYQTKMLCWLQIGPE